MPICTITKLDKRGVLIANFLKMPYIAQYDRQDNALIFLQTLILNLYFSNLNRL